MFVEKGAEWTCCLAASGFPGHLPTRPPWPLSSHGPSDVEGARGLHTRPRVPAGPWQALFYPLNGSGQPGEETPNLGPCFPRLPGRGPSRMPASRTEGWGYFKAECSFSVGLTGTFICGCWVPCGNRLLPRVWFTPSYWCACQAGVASAPSPMPPPGGEHSFLSYRASRT